MTPAKVMALSTLPTQSSRRAASGVSGSERAASSIAPRPAGTLTANSSGQAAPLRMPAATLGPSAVEVATTSALKPTPRPSRFDG